MLTLDKEFLCTSPCASGDLFVCLLFIVLILTNLSTRRDVDVLNFVALMERCTLQHDGFNIGNAAR